MSDRAVRPVRFTTLRVCLIQIMADLILHIPEKSGIRSGQNKHELIPSGSGCNAVFANCLAYCFRNDTDCPIAFLMSIRIIDHFQSVHIYACADQIPVSTDPLRPLLIDVIFHAAAVI